MRLFLTLMIGILLISSCNESNQNQATNSKSDNNKHVTVKEVLQTSSYTYLLVDENNEEYWVAVGKMDAKAGDDFYYESGLEMNDFQSKELDRTFESVLFVDKISSVPIIPNTQPQTMPAQTGAKAKAEMKDIAIEHTSGEISIGELYKNRKDYEGKTIVVRGEVVKVNEGIMNLNWIHIQDGTSDAGNFDLTITTTDMAKLADVVSFEGTVTLNKDFGAGYTYELIIEGASLK